MTVVAAARVVTGHEVYAPGWVEYAAGRVLAVGTGRPARVDRDLGQALVVPGFVDTHVHGGGGGSFTAAEPSSAGQAVGAHRRRGTTTTMASLVTARPDELLASVSMLAELYEDEVIAGIHLEGPWISAHHRGAHDPTQLRDPDPAEISRLLRAGRGAVQMVTLAPELAGGLDAVRQVVDAGATAAIGHTDATYAQTLQAIEAGARVGTHLYNAMRHLHHREPGPVVALLDDPRVTVELIADGTHLHPAIYRHTSETAGPGRVALVTDAMAAATLGDGAYQLGRLHVTVEDGTARLTGTDTIAGSTTTMDRLLRAAVRNQATRRPETLDRAEPAPDDDSLLRAVQQASLTPARALRWAEVGDLRPGQRADLVVLDRDLTVIEVIRRGVPVPDAAPPGAGRVKGR